VTLVFERKVAEADDLLGAYELADRVCGVFDWIEA
jgi:hypothetical protein